MFPSIAKISSSSQTSVFNYTFSDVNLQFSNQPDEFVYDIDAVIQAFLILLGTPKRERWWRPEWGTYSLEKLLFEPFDITTADQIAESIKSISESSTNGNIRLIIDGVSVRPDYSTQTYEVNLRINVPELGNKKVQFFLRQPE
jgi:hypothetical protein